MFNCWSNHRYFAKYCTRSVISRKYILLLLILLLLLYTLACLTLCLLHSLLFYPESSTLSNGLALAFLNSRMSYPHPSTLAHVLLPTFYTLTSRTLAHGLSRTFTLLHGLAPTFSTLICFCRTTSPFCVLTCLSLCLLLIHSHMPDPELFTLSHVVPRTFYTLTCLAQKLLLSHMS